MTVPSPFEIAGNLAAGENSLGMPRRVWSLRRPRPEQLEPAETLPLKFLALRDNCQDRILVNVCSQDD